MATPWVNEWVTNDALHLIFAFGKVFVLLHYNSKLQTIRQKKREQQE